MSGSSISPEQMRRYLRMYLVIGSVNCREKPLRVVEEALSGGATMIQFREKGPGALTGEAKLALALELQAACRRAGVPFIVNDDVELAARIGADGLHVGQDDESAGAVRARIGNRILGVSAHTVKEARTALVHGADYIGVGPVYPTISKDDARPVQGTGMIQDMRAQGIQLPIVGIGGINAERAAEVVRAGADGVAVISAVTQAANVREAARNLLEQVARAAGR
ncbi:thiamine phosphate synthase [Paenibacillus woosongensis]|uniref:Thiamine-phosphate synthase n=1 Tax=Paenibacillus woosongensis TaxID=307580 RepID=A0ABQ4MUN2_9BACL|nr:thiamine phosphate synthase [Paenibacillus woosongensis]GIP59649.1 thiamine-phosphate synthase [Paenibacillus woosongensis]